ncbi:hypothetical protein Tco_1339498 [Tanacetum coccineum]
MELSTIAQLTKTSNNKILEAKGSAIQSNMNLKDLDYSNPKLQIGTTYSRCVRSVGDISINIIDTDYQLAASSATYYYLNLKIPEVKGSRALYKAMYQATPPLTIRKAPYEDATKEKLRNRYPLKTTMEQDPDTYKPTDPAKVPPEVLAPEGKSCVFQFHFNTVGNMTYLTLDDVFDITNGNESASSSSHKTIPVTPPSSPTATTHPANKEDQGHRAISQSAKRALFQQPSTETKKPKKD